MKMFDIHGDLVNVDVRASSYPVKFKSKSSLQGQVGKWLEEHFLRKTVLEEFSVPGTRFHVDYFLPEVGLIVEINGDQHYKHVAHFHGSKETSKKFAKQLGRDRKVIEWAEMNGFDLIEIRTIEDLEQIDA
jgi:very-short-patch-repair endonuclease